MYCVVWYWEVAHGRGVEMLCYLSHSNECPKGPHPIGEEVDISPDSYLGMGH